MKLVIVQPINQLNCLLQGAIAQTNACLLLRAIASSFVKSY
ncbi:hypothetical protein [Nostoc sp. FACHB-280]|nr:hypothetical protein [Nostoc sp. FACHB-280]